ncbi:MAG TPA: hypothetical protein VES89_05350, partial [Candidatus Competibacteraceae bacterium]|nr:hypothetical protein [Candidatus Competibacteraceae bacterium]
LGDLPGGSFTSQANGVSADGSTVVGSSSSTQGTEAFSWRAGTGMLGLGDLPGGTFSSTARAVSANGSVIVGSGSTALGTKAFKWSAGTGMVGLAVDFPVPPEEQNVGKYSEATGVSANGSVIVGTSYPDPVGQFAAFRLDQGAGVRELQKETHATGVSADGAVVVGWSEAQIDRAFRWTKDAGVTILDDRPIYGGTIWPASRAFGVSADGSVVVGASNFENGLGAFRWTQGNGLVSLGDLPGGEFYSEALGASANGSVIVGDSDSGAGQEAFIWDPAHGMRSLLDLLVTAGLDSDLLSGWTLSAATAISADGLTVVGNGIHGGRQEAWLARLDSALVVPEIEAAGAPAALAILVGGLLLIGESARNLRSWRGRNRVL